MTEKEALLWVLGILGSLCAAAITIDKVLEIIHKYIKKAQEPDNEQNKRLDEMDKRIGTLEQGQLQHTQALARDQRRFDEIDEVSRLTSTGCAICWTRSSPATTARGCRRAAPTSTTIC